MLKNHLLLLLFTAALLNATGCIAVSATEKKEYHGGADGRAAHRPVLINLTAGAGSSQQMAFELARHALDDGRAVTLFLNVDAPPLAKAAPDGFAPVSSLIDEGAQVLVCASCMERLRMPSTSLADGAEIASRERLFTFVDRNAAVFSYGPAADDPYALRH